MTYINLIAHNFKNRSIKYSCELHLKRLKKNSSPNPYLHNTTKYGLCNFLDYSDSLLNGFFYDPGHNISCNFNKKFPFMITVDNMKKRHNSTREILYLDEEGLEAVFNKAIKQIKNDINLTYSKNMTELQELLFINNLADAVYRAFSNNSLSEVPNISSKIDNILVI